VKKSIKNATIRAAKKSLFDGFRHGCCIAKGGRIVTKGVNTNKPKTPDSPCSTHAEVWALKRLLTILARHGGGKGFHLYVARVNRTDDIAFSKPCSKCLKALRESGVIDLIHFTTDSGWESIEI
jgi:tRNA(Arg) A34 adenosine deaminase TadA